MIKQTEKEHIFPNSELNIQEIGSMIGKMEEVKNIGQIKLSISDNTKMEKNMERANSCGLMIVLMKVTFYKIIFTDMENMNGKMEEYMKESGKTIKCKEKEHFYGLMEENTLVITFKIENKALVFLLSKMVEYMKENG